MKNSGAINPKKFSLLTWSNVLTARRERIASVSFVTGTNGYMINYTTFCIDTADSLTWIPAMLCQTGQMTRTIRINDAFRLAPSSIWITHVRRNTGTSDYSVSNETICVFGTR